MHTFAGAVDGVERLAEFGGERVGGGDRVLAGLGLNGAEPACGFHEFPDWPAGAGFDPPADGEGGEHVVRWASMESRLRWQTGLACRSDFDIRNDSSMFQSSW